MQGKIHFLPDYQVKNAGNPVKNGLYLGHIIVKVCSAEGTLGWFLEGGEFAVKQQTADRTSEANGI